MAMSTASVTTDTTNYTRIHLILMKGGTLLTKTLFLKRVKDLSPAGRELTVDEFLGQHSVKILSTSTGKNNKDKLYPPTRTSTNLDEWDLPLYCVILKTVCDLPMINKLDMGNLKTIRNELSHLHDPSLTDADFKSRLSVLDVIFTRSLQIINNPLFEGEITNLVQRYKTGALSVDEVVKINHKHIELLGNQLKMMENKLDTVLKNQNNQNTQMATALSMLKKIDDKLPPGSDVDIQDVHVIIEVKNCTRDKEQELLEFLLKQFNETISKPECTLNKDFPNLAMHTISEAVCKTLTDFLAKGRHVLKVENGSISLTVKCNSISSFVGLVSDSLDGSLLDQLRSLKDALRSWDGCGGVDLYPTISPDEITSAILKLAKDLDEKLPGKDQNVEPLLPMEHPSAEWDGSSTTQGTSLLCSAGSSLRLTIKPDTIEQRKEIEENFIGSFTEGLEQFQNELRKDPSFRNVVIETKLLAQDNFSTDSENSQESMACVLQKQLNRNLRTHADELTLPRQREKTLSTDDERSESDLPDNEGSLLLYQKDEKGNARGQGLSITPDSHLEQEPEPSDQKKFTPDWSREDLGITDTEVLFIDKYRENALPDFDTDVKRPAEKGEKDVKCPICYDALNTECLLKCSCCKKDFHDRCMTVWLTTNQNCPLCKQTWNSNYKETQGVICPICLDALNTECILKCSCCNNDFHDRCMTFFARNTDAMASSLPHTSKQRLALVVHFQFDENVSNAERATRHASTEDDANLQRVIKILGFDLIDCHTFMNVKAHTFDGTFPCFIHQKDANIDVCSCLCCSIRKYNFTNLECFLLVISSHDAQSLVDDEMVQEIEFSDKILVRLDDIIEAFSDSKCKNLKGVPRVIILDVCRSVPDFPRKDLLFGRGYDPGHNVILEYVKSSETTDLASIIQNMKFESESAEDTDGREKTESGATYVSTAQESYEKQKSRVEPDIDYVFEFPEKTLQNLPNDFLLVFFSYANKKSFHDLKRGSWMIEELTKVVAEHDFIKEPNMNFLTILNKVTGRVALNREGKYGQKQMVTIYHRLLKPIIFTKQEGKEHTDNRAPESFYEK